MISSKGNIKTKKKLHVRKKVKMHKYTRIESICTFSYGVFVDIGNKTGKDLYHKCVILKKYFSMLHFSILQVNL